MDRTECLVRALALLDFGPPSAPPASFVVETGHDEAVIVGTSNSLVDVARVLLGDALAMEVGTVTEEADHHLSSEGSHRWITSSRVKAVFDEMGDVWPVTVYVAANQETATHIRAVLKR